MLLFIVYSILFVDTVDTKIKAHNSLNAMFVKTPRGKATIDLLCLLSCGFSYSTVQGGSFVKFLGIANYNSDCRQDAQPIPNS